MSSLSHHGIEGQRWGVRRFQNKDGTLTSAGKKRYSVEAVDVNSSRKEIKKLVGDFSKKDKDFFFGEKHSYGYGDYDHNGDKVAKRFVIKEGKNIVAFIDAERGDHHSNDTLNIVVGTAQSARGKGYASILSKTMVDWYEAEGYKNASMLEWNANKDNIGSRKAAEKAGFKEVLGDNDIGYRYSKNAKKELDELSKARMKTKAIEKEVSDKINSDFKKTKLSKISPNTTITPYGEGQTNWNSELGFYKSMVVDHYATKWAKKKHSDDIAKYTKASSDWSSAYSKFDKKRRKAKHTSIGGTMYIEDNALILGDSSYLEHHGILGQKWGVRRFQNKDGTRTAAGKARDQKNAAKTVKNARLFRASANAFQGTKFGVGANKRALKEEKAYGDMAYEILNKGKNKAEYDDLSRDIDAVASFEYEEYSKKRDAMIEINARLSLEYGGVKNPSDEQVAEEWTYWADFDEDWGADLKCNSYDRYLVSKGYNPNEIHKRYKDDYAKLRDLASKDAEEYLGPYGDTKITYKDKYTKEIVKTTAKDELTNKIVDEATMWIDDYGAAQRADLVYTDKELSEMRAENAKYSPLKHSALFIEDGTLYLSHHGIRGQRWGVRRFQNRDGSLTNAGRKRLGYATKGAAQAVGKAFKAGVKVGGNAVKAAKAHHEKKEAEKLQKKKEKASKTRLGVMANKDLFTNEEIRKLNERFKLEDEMKMATLQKGVEIAKAVGTIAQNVGTVAKTYEDVTGQSLSPIKRKAAEEKARQDKEDRDRRIAREDADEARKAAKEERDIAIHEQTLRKAIAAADTQEFTAQKTKAEADSSVLDAIKKGQDFNGGGDAKTDATGKSWIEKATSGGDNPFDKMIYDRDPDYKAAKDAHDEKAEWDQHVKERDARIAARERGMQPEDESSGKQKPQQPQAKSQPQSQPQQKKSDDDDDDRGGFAKLKEALPFDKGRYVNRKAAEKAKDVKESAEEERTKKQDEKAAKAAIDTIIKDYQHQDDTARSINPTKYDREVAASVIKGKAKNALNKVTHPVDTVAKKISDKAREEKWTKERAKLFEEYQDNREKLGTEFANEAYVRAKKQSLQNLGYRGEALDKKLNETPFSKKKKAKHDAFTIQNGVLFVDSSDGLAHHGIRGQKWGVRRFQNTDGTRTEAGKKHDAKLAAKAEKKQAKADMKAAKAAAKAKAKDIRLTEKAENLRKREIERYEKMAVKQPKYKTAYETMAKHAKESDRAELLDINKTANIRGAGQAVVGALMLSTFTPTPVAVAGGIAFAKAMKMYNVDQVRTIKTNARLNKEDRERKLKEAQSIKLEHSFAIQNGVLFINAGEPYLEHHGVKGMKWGKHLMAGKGVDAEGGGGGGFAEDDEKLKEMAKKAGMSVAEYRTKMASKLSGAASKVGSAVYDAAGGSHKKNAEGWRKMAQEESNAARASEKSSHENSARAASQDRKYGSGGDVYRRAADSDKENAKTHHSNAKVRSERAASEQAAYEKSLAGKYDKMKADRARKKSAKEKKRLQTQPSAEAKRISVKDKHLIINGNRSNGTRSLAVGETGEKPKSFKEKAYDALGGKYKTQAAEAHKDMVYYKNKADDISRRANAQSRAANANKKAGNVREYMANKEGARQLESEAKDNRLGQWDNAKKANSAQWKYDHSLAGLYDKATGKHKQVHKKTKVPNLMNQANYYYKETSNSKLFNHGKGKAKTAKEQAKAEVWTAADHQIKAKEHNDMSATQGHNESYYGQLYKNAAEREARLAEGAYRRAAALGKQASRETSTSSRPRARKKKHTSGGSGVVVRRPGRKPVSRTKRVTQSSTGVKRRGATGSGRRVR